MSLEYEQKYKVLKSENDKKRRLEVWKSFDARARSIEAPFVKAVRKAAETQKKLVDEAIKEAVKNNKDVLTAVNNLFSAKMNDGLKHTLAPAFINGLEIGAIFGKERLDKKDSVISDKLRKLFNAWVDSYGLEMCTDMNDTTKKKLRRALSDAIFEGDGLNVQVEKLLSASEDVFENMSKSRAVMIARTESCQTINAGSTMLYKSEGIEQKEWISVQDDRTRDAHLIMDGVVVPMDAKFEVPATSQGEGAFMEYPGDPTAPAEQVVNCRCTTAPFVKF